MLYSKDNELHYFVPNDSNPYTCELYAFKTMIKNDANRTAFALIQLQTGTKEFFAENVKSYSLILDFLGNARCPLYTAVIDEFLKFLEKNNYKFSVNEDPLRVIVENLKVEDILSLIMDEDFQMLNKLILSTSATQWHTRINY